MNKYTVFAVYADNLQPYAATVEAGSPEAAIHEAQIQCYLDNRAQDISLEVEDYGPYTLVGFQVVAGEVEVLPVDDMPLAVKQKVRYEHEEGIWTIQAFHTEAPVLCAYIQRDRQWPVGEEERIVLVETSSLTPVA